MAAQACKNCHFSKPGDKAYHIECRRFPPSVLTGSFGSPYREAPMVSKDTWCGEWRKHGAGGHAEPETAQERMWKWFWR